MTSDFWNGIRAFDGLASAGRFAVSPEGGAALLAAIDDFHEELNVHREHLSRIQAQPPLGLLKGGEVMAPFMLDVATDADGFVTRLVELQVSLRTAAAAIEVAMANYRATDHAAEDALRHVDGMAG